MTMIMIMIVIMITIMMVMMMMMIIIINYYGQYCESIVCHKIQCLPTGLGNYTSIMPVLVQLLCHLGATSEYSM